MLKACNLWADTTSLWWLPTYRMMCLATHFTHQNLHPLALAHLSSLRSFNYVGLVFWCSCTFVSLNELQQPNPTCWAYTHHPSNVLFLGTHPLPATCKGRACHKAHHECISAYVFGWDMHCRTRLGLQFSLSEVHSFSLSKLSIEFSIFVWCKMIKCVYYAIPYALVEKQAHRKRAWIISVSTWCFIA